MEDNDDTRELHFICFEILQQRTMRCCTISSLESLTANKITKYCAFLNTKEIYFMIKDAGIIQLDILRDGFLMDAWFDTIKHVDRLNMSNLHQ